MASTRSITGSAPVGSLAWIENERSTIEQLEAQELEEFAFAAKNDLEWLNEHMADIFERNTIDMAELMKTPGTLRGKTPRSIRKKPDVGREALADIFTANRSPEVPESQFNQALTQFAKSDVASPAPAPSAPKSPAKAPMAPPPVPNSLQKVPSDKSLRSDVVEEPIYSKSFADSGFFSASQPNSQFDIPEQRFTRGHARRSSGSQASVDVKMEPEMREPVGRRTRSSVAKEEEGVYEPTPETMEVEEVAQIERTPTSTLDAVLPAVARIQSPVKRSPSPKKSATPQRRSGRIASRGESLSREPSVTEKSSIESYQEATRPSATHQTAVAVEIPVASREEPESELEPTQKDDSDDEKSSSSRSPTPEVNLVRKSSMNFAPLPAREPLTSKRPIAGRDSHLENIRQPNPARASWMNKKSNGKSLGGSSRPIIPRNAEDEEMTTVEEKRSYDSIRQQESQAYDEVIVQETKETTKVPTKTGDEEDSEDERRRHTKANTKRLHDKIQQLGKLSVARPKSTASMDEDPRYPSLGDMDMDVDPESPIAAPQKTPIEALRAVYEPPTQPPATTHVERKDIVEHRPHSPRTRTEDLSRNADPFARVNSPAARPSPLRGDSQFNYQNAPSRDPLKSPTYGTPSRHHQDRDMSPDSSPFKNIPSSPLKNNAPTYDSPHYPTETPDLAPKKLFSTDDSYSQSKGNMATYLAKAKQLLARSGTSADERAASVNPGHAGADTTRSEAKTLHNYDRSEKPGRKLYGEPSYPSLDRMPSVEYENEVQLSRSGSFKETDHPARNSRPRHDESNYDYPPTRQIRNTKSQEEGYDEQVRRSRSPTKSKRDEEASLRAAQQERERREQEQLMRERELLKNIQKEEERRLAAVEEEKRRQAQAAAEERRRQQRAAEEEERRRQQEEEELRRQQEEEELRRQEEEELQRQQEEEEAALQRAAAEAEAQAAYEMELERSQSGRSQRERTGSVDPERPQSRIQKGSIRFRPSENKPPIRSKSQNKMRPAPVTIKVGTTSQMDQRRTLGHTGPSVAALKSAFEPPSRPDSRNTLQTQDSRNTLQTQSSQGSIRSVTSQSNKVKSLQAAANARQREQEERERRELQRKDSERRRQEKKKQEEEQRKLEEQKKLEEQRRQQQQRARANTATSAPKTLNRVPQIHNLRQPSEEPTQQSQPPQTSSKYGKLGFVKGGSIKRVMPIDTEDGQASRAVPSRPGFPAFQQDGSKKRRTNDFDDVEQYQPQSHKQPIRPSAVKNQIPQRAMPTHGYKSVNALSSGQTIKAVGSASVAGPSRQIPHVDGVKYTADKIHFAGEQSERSQVERPPREPRPGPAAPSAHFKTPATKSGKYNKVRSKTPTESPMYPNPEDVELPAILTDSEDEEEEYHNLPRWVESPYLREMLERQRDMDPAEIFGEVKPPDMEAMFKGNLDARRAERLRMRTSSAHWGGPDGLTQEEMLKDLEERRKLHAQGHWTYPAGL